MYNKITVPGAIPTLVLFSLAGFLPLLSANCMSSTGFVKQDIRKVEMKFMKEMCLERHQEDMLRYNTKQ